MATWIAHLRIAENLLGQIHGLDAPAFTLGNLAPDSGKPDAKWENFTPPAHVSHFQDPGDKRRDSADLVFFRRHLLPFRSDSGGDHFSFRLGYFFHLITDNLWGERILRPTQGRFAEQFAANKDFIWEVKEDWYGLDFIHVREHPGSLYWRVFLGCEPQTGGLDFLVPESIGWSVAHIQQYYQRTDEEIQAMCRRPFVYLSRAEMDGFVDEAAGQLYRIYQQLWVNGMATEGYNTALALPADPQGELNG